MPEETATPTPHARPGLSILLSLSLALIALGISLLFLFDDSAGPDWARDGLPLDDTWIHLVYAHNLSNEGWFYYSGNQTEAGMSSPLWVILLALPLAAGAGPVATAKGMSLLFGLLLPPLVFDLGKNLRLPWPVAYAVGVYCAIDPNLAYARVSGMEVTLTAVLLVVALRTAIKRHYLRTGLLLGLMVITRGELALAAGALAGALLLEIYVRRDEVVPITPQELAVATKLLLPPLILGGAWAIFNYSVNGRFLPNTYYVKHNYALGYINPDNLEAIWHGYYAHTGLLAGWLAVPVLLLSAVGCIWLWEHFKGPGLLIVLLPVAITYALSINLKLNPAPWNFTARRYLDFLLPLIALAAAAGGVMIWQRVAAVKQRAVVLAAPLVMFGLVALIAMSTGTRALDMPEEYSWNTRNVEEVNVTMGRWMHDNLPVDTFVGVTDAGAMTYLGQRRTVDFLGLNEHRAIGRPLEELIVEYQPDYVALFRSPVIDSWPFLTEITNFAAERNTILGGADLVLYEVDPAAFPQ